MADKIVVPGFLTPEWHERLDSTNTSLVARLKGGEALPCGFVLAAHEQTAGRGRYERQWISRPGRDLAFSFLWLTDADALRLSSLTMAVALGVGDAVESLGVSTQVRWPNDLMVDGCKICGILAERCEGGEAATCGVVVGVGLNVNMEGPEAAAIDRPATSILLETGCACEVESVLDRILEALPPWMGRWEAGGFPALHDSWFRRHCGMGDRVEVGEGRQRREGVLTGFGEAGQLLLRRTDGSIEEVWAGDVGAL